MLTLFKMGFFGAAHGWGPGQKTPLSKICHTYPTLEETWHNTLPKEDPKNIYHVTHPLSSADFSIFLEKSAMFVVSGNTGIDCILVHDI